VVKLQTLLKRQTKEDIVLKECRVVFFLAITIEKNLIVVGMEAKQFKKMGQYRFRAIKDSQEQATTGLFENTILLLRMFLENHYQKKQLFTMSMEIQATIKTRTWLSVKIKHIIYYYIKEVVLLSPVVMRILESA